MSMYVEKAKAEEMLLVQVDVGSLAKMIQVLVERCSRHELMSETLSHQRQWRSRMD
jgi:hypothetical protein